MTRPAVFLDRDNTLILNDGYLGDPDRVALMPGAPEAVARLRAMGFAIVTISNQSGVGRGMFTEDDVRAVDARMDAMLVRANPGAIIDRHEFCPDHPKATVRKYCRESERRKPNPGMMLDAADAMGLDLKRSWLIGDAPRDVTAGHRAGCRTILLRDPILEAADSEAAREAAEVEPDYVASSLIDATDFIEMHASEREASSDAHATPADDRATSGPEAADATEAEDGGAPPEPDGPDATNDAAPPAEMPVSVLPRSGTSVVLESSRSRPNRAGAVADESEARPERGAVDAPFEDAVRSDRSDWSGDATVAAPAPLAKGDDMVKDDESSGTPSAVPAEPGAPREAHVALAPRDTALSVAIAEVEHDAPPVAAAARLAGGPSSDVRRPGTDAQTAMLERILDEIRRGNDPPQDFSIAKVMAGVVQGLALAAAFAALIQKDNVAVFQMLMLLAIFLQAMVTALLLMGR